jgi:hypothetical protein
MYQSDLEEVGLPAIVACHFGVKALWGDSFVSGGLAWRNEVPFFAELFLQHGNGLAPMVSLFYC